MAFRGMWGEIFGVAREVRSGLVVRPTRLAMGALPAAVVAAAGAGVFAVRKRQEQPVKDFLVTRTGFDCVGLQDAGLPTPDATRRSLLKAGASSQELAALRRAARRLRGPLDRDLVAAECLLADAAGGSSSSSVARASKGWAASQEMGGSIAERRQRLYSDLVSRWRAAGFLGEPEDVARPQPSVWAKLNPVTAEDERYGRDVGTEVALCQLAESTDGIQSVRLADWGVAADKLEQHGVVTLRGLLSPKTVAAVRQRLHIHSSILDARRGGTTDTGHVRDYNGKELTAEDEDLEPVVSAQGRLHFYLRGRELEKAVIDVQAGVMPLVWEYFAAQGYGDRRPYVSEVQLLVAVPTAVDQFWHVDNAARGVTLVVPLTPVQEDLGPEMFLPGSHHFFDTMLSLWQRARRCGASLLQSDGVAVATMAAGDAVLYDARTLHRCASNRRYDRTRIALVFRYDTERPPGVGAVGTQLVAWGGNALAGFQQLYARLPGSRAEAMQPKPPAS